MFSQHENVFDTDQKGVCIKWQSGDVYFYISEVKDAMEIHIKATSKEAKRMTRYAAKDVILWVNVMFPWCRGLIATVSKKTVYNLCIKVGFKEVGRTDKSYLMVYDYGVC